MIIYLYMSLDFFWYTVALASVWPILPSQPLGTNTLVLEYNRTLVTAVSANGSNKDYIKGTVIRAAII